MSNVSISTMVFAGILSTMGNARFGCYFRLSNHAGSARNHRWPSVLLFDCVASSGRWKEHTQDSKVGVSFLLILKGEIKIKNGSLDRCETTLGVKHIPHLLLSVYEFNNLELPWFSASIFYLPP